MSNPSGGGGSGRRYSGALFNSDGGVSLSSFLFFLKKPQAFPFLLSIFVLLTWLSLRFHQSPPSSIRSHHADHWRQQSDHFSNLARFPSSTNLPSSHLLHYDPRGWLLNPLLVAQEAAISGILLSSSFFFLFLFFSESEFLPCSVKSSD